MSIAEWAFLIGTIAQSLAALVTFIALVRGTP